MQAANDLIEKVVNAARIPRGKRRYDIRRELLSHVEDFVTAAREAGRPENEIQTMVAASFGDPELIARGFAWVYRRERAVVRISVFLVSSVAVTLLMLSAILALQAGMALGFGRSVVKLLASPHTATEALDILFTVTTYAGLVALEELFQGKRFFKALGLLALSFAASMGVCAALHFHAPFLVFGTLNGTFFRAIQVFVRSGKARTAMVAAAVVLLGVGTFKVIPTHLQYTLAASASWLAMGLAYRAMPVVVARIDNALVDRLQRI